MVDFSDDEGIVEKKKYVKPTIESFHLDIPFLAASCVPTSNCKPDLCRPIASCGPDLCYPAFCTP